MTDQALQIRKATCRVMILPSTSASLLDVMKEMGKGAH